MSNKQIESSKELNSKLLSGANKIADCVGSTMGPKGRNVILKEKDKRPIVTKDGVTVAKFFSLSDPIENSAVEILKQASEQTANSAFDGTTTSMVLSRAIFSLAQIHLLTGASPIELKRGMDKACNDLVQKLSELSKPIESLEDIERIATISANNDVGIGKMIATAIDTIGKDGSISIQDSVNSDTKLDLHEGFRFPGGLCARDFVTDERRQIAKFENALVLVTDLEIRLIDDILPLLEQVARVNKPLVVVAEQIEGQALAALLYNKLNGNLKIAAIQAPGFGDERRNLLSDLALTTGAKFLSRLQGHNLRTVTVKDLGEISTLESSKFSTTIVSKEGKVDLDIVNERIKSLQFELENTPVGVEAEKVQQRITRLASGVAVISVGAPTQVEQIEKKHRVEDALGAVKSAQEEGILPGGGVSLIACSTAVKNTLSGDQKKGYDVVVNACKAPFEQMCKNADLNPDIMLDKIFNDENAEGIDFSTGEIVQSLYQVGVIDPAKVTRNALQNAVSVASTLLTTSFAVIETE